MNKRVTVITPVYNGAAFLQDCIQSVLDQTYVDFDYFIVDNASTDGSRDIAAAAAARDDRITLVESSEHVGLIPNWNRSLQTVTDKTEYIKFVHADDWIFPNCLECMVEILDQEPAVGIVSAYRLEEDSVSLDRLPSAAPKLTGARNFTMNGQSVARAILQERASVLGSPTALMFRKRFIGDPTTLFSTEYLHADKDACLRILQDCDFGFIRQVLTYTRRHNESVTSMTNRLDTRRQENLLFLQKFGPANLSETEYRDTLTATTNAYYRFLASKVGTGQGDEFWDSHRELLRRAGSPLQRWRLFRAFVRRWINPGKAIREMQRNSANRNPASNVQAQHLLKMSRGHQASRDEQEKSA